MNGKKTTTLHGTPARPLIVGCCAMIRYRGQILRTSQIVAIHSCTAEAVYFETLNTNYTLLLNPAPQPETGTFLTCMAA